MIVKQYNYQGLPLEVSLTNDLKFITRVMNVSQILLTTKFMSADEVAHKSIKRFEKRIDVLVKIEIDTVKKFFDAIERYALETDVNGDAYINYTLFDYFANVYTSTILGNEN